MLTIGGGVKGVYGLQYDEEDTVEMKQKVKRLGHFIWTNRKLSSALLKKIGLVNSLV